MQQRATVLNRIEKVLEDANIKLASVASHVLGQSGRTMLRAMVHGILDPNKLAEMAKAKLRNKIPELRLAFGARFEERHRFQMQELLDQMHFLDDKVAEFAQQIEQRSQPWNEHIQPPNILPPGPEFVPATKRVPVNTTAAKRVKGAAGSDEFCVRLPGLRPTPGTPTLLHSSAALQPSAASSARLWRSVTAFS